MTKIRFDEQGLRRVLHIAVERQIDNLFKKRADRYGCPKKGGLAFHGAGCMGEAAVSRLLGYEYDGNLGNFRADDAGPYQVRATEWPNGRLLIHKPDRDDKPFILVTVDGVCATVRGWKYAGAVKEKGVWRELQEGRPAYCLDQIDLEPIETLPLLAR